jgi:hypothetical protein
LRTARRLNDPGELEIGAVVVAFALVPTVAFGTVAAGIADVIAAGAFAVGHGAIMGLGRDEDKKSAFAQRVGGPKASAAT